MCAELADGLTVKLSNHSPAFRAERLVGPVNRSLRESVREPGSTVSRIAGGSPLWQSACRSALHIFCFRLGE
jgi:hypothetical protein